MHFVLFWLSYCVELCESFHVMLPWSDANFLSEEVVCHTDSFCLNSSCKAQYTPPTPTRRNCRVSSRRRCVHEFATSWRQFRRVVGMNTPVGSRDPYGCVVRSHHRICWQSSRIHVHTADADVTRLDSFVSSASAVCIGLYMQPPADMRVVC